MNDPIPENFNLYFQFFFKFKLVLSLGGCVRILFSVTQKGHVVLT